jgi:hypothetical protein
MGIGDTTTNSGGEINTPKGDSRAEISKAEVTSPNRVPLSAVDTCGHFRAQVSDNS